MVIQAPIVRIMKDRETFKHELLIQEVIKQLSSRFEPKISVIEGCIDILIEKECLQRNPKETDVLFYLG
ncbi:unnamed protein product [Rotaria sordida]|uniref:Cullin neddylation domain-containing protein n=1 Tax=Rotaria sordida TaxID=392033 RepID=A0A815XG66_9BILA|nr:unnamed protein product [Rotaria sordida]